MLTLTSITSAFDSSECARKRPQIEEGQIEAILPPQESHTATASTDTLQAEQESSPNADLTPGTLQIIVPLQISGDNVTQNYDTVGLLIDPDGTERHQITPGEHSSGRFLQQNILIESSGPSPHTKRCVSVCAGSPESAWRLVIDEYIVHHIKKCTVSEAHRQMQNQTFALTVEELERFIAVMYARRVTEKVPYHCRRFGLKKWGVLLCKTAMARNRLCEILLFSF